MEDTRNKSEITNSFRAAHGCMLAISMLHSVMAASETPEAGIAAYFIATRAGFLRGWQDAQKQLSPEDVAAYDVIAQNIITHMNQVESSVAASVTAATESDSMSNAEDTTRKGCVPGVTNPHFDQQQAHGCPTSDCMATPDVWSRRSSGA